MSTTTTDPFPASAVTPAAPSVSGDIALAAGATNLVARAEANPELMAWLQTQFGTQMAAAQKSPFAWFAGLGIGWLFSRYGIQADATAQSLLSVLSAVLAGDVWQWASAKWWPVKAAPTPAV